MFQAERTYLNIRPYIVPSRRESNRRSNFRKIADAIVSESIGELVSYNFPTHLIGKLTSLPIRSTEQLMFLLGYFNELNGEVRRGIGLSTRQAATQVLEARFSNVSKFEEQALVLRTEEHAKLWKDLELNADEATFLLLQGLLTTYALCAQSNLPAVIRKYNNLPRRIGFVKKRREFNIRERLILAGYQSRS